MFKEIHFLWDYYVMYFMYNNRKRKNYHRYMINKWKSKYSSIFYRNIFLVLLLMDLLLNPLSHCYKRLGLLLTCY
jgi:hypothetical protein